jgi:tRNA-splicing ligase RtcB
MVQELDGLYGGKIKAWVEGVAFEERAREQASNVAALPFIYKHVAIMPDVHAAYGATVGSVIPTKGAIVPYAVGVDIGCGMSAVRTSLTADDLPDNLLRVRTEIERAVPHGGPGAKGSWAGAGADHADLGRQDVASVGPRRSLQVPGREDASLEKAYTATQLGSLGGGNHFIEICLDEDSRVWVMLHSGSRGVGNLIGTKFVAEARELMLHRDGRMPMDKDLAWLEEGEDAFDRYVEAVAWGQDFARTNRDVMLVRVLESLRKSGLPSFKTDKTAVNCTTTTSRRRPTSAKRCSSPARARSRRRSVNSASSPVRWAPSRSSCAARAMRNHSARAAMGPGA